MTVADLKQRATLALLPVMQVTLDLRGEAQTQELAGSEATVPTLITAILGAVMTIAALLLLFYLIWGAIEWITAGGDSGKIQKARDKMTQAVIGIIVLSTVLAIFQLILGFLGIEALRVNSGSNYFDLGETTGSTRP